MSKIDKNLNLKVRKGIDKLVSPLVSFATLEASAGIFLLFIAIIAMFSANLDFAKNAYFSFINTPVQFTLGQFSLGKTLLLLVNDGLMAIFFYLVGLEIKKEILDGELSSPRKASFSFFAAIGGMVVPALIYVFINWGQNSVTGWGIPMATDIAFALGVVTLLGKRVPSALKIFLLALAIVDDLGAILIIALFYSGDISSQFLAVAAALLALLAIFNYAGLRNKFFGIFIGVVVWFCFLKSGVHATIAGVLLALLTPTRDFGLNLEEKSKNNLDKYIHDLHPWSAFLIMPIFAFFNAGVDISGFSLNQVLGANVSMGIIFGLVVGKPLGVVSMAYLATKLSLADLPEGTNWLQITAVGFISGIGFTMSLFISSLAFNDVNLVAYSKVSILIGSVLAMVIGFILLFLSVNLKNKKLV